MSRFFVSSDSVDAENGIIVITGEDVHHIGSVLRAMPGDALEVSDGSGVAYNVVIERMDKNSIKARITGSYPADTEPPVDVALFQGIPKADKMDYIVQKCVELGVKKIVPMVTNRTIVKLAGNSDAMSKTNRWRRIAVEAAKQCNRGIVPLVEEPVRFDMALEMAGNCGLKLIPYEEERNVSLRRQLQQFHRTVAVFIGPEGGFDPEEVEKAKTQGFIPVTLGPRILRTETAGMAVIAIIMYEFGDMGNIKI